MSKLLPKKLTHSALSSNILTQSSQAPKKDNPPSFPPGLHNSQPTGNGGRGFARTCHSRSNASCAEAVGADNVCKSEARHLEALWESLSKDSRDEAQKRRHSISYIDIIIGHYHILCSLVSVLYDYNTRLPSRMKLVES